ncbi:hypothetical protein AABB24_009656 [Solanum stoloniferum]|uniref:Uncharacterized protein n=1 Tax=Solanum stoloniferum TaxID=62892 RepID=A0ABD2UJG7_9SOLN
MRKTISSWKLGELSDHCRRITLAKSTLNAIPAYAMQYFQLPMKICNTIDNTAPSHSFILKNILLVSNSYSKAIALTPTRGLIVNVGIAVGYPTPLPLELSSKAL